LHSRHLSIPSNRKKSSHLPSTLQNSHPQPCIHRTGRYKKLRQLRPALEAALSEAILQLLFEQAIQKEELKPCVASYIPQVRDKYFLIFRDISFLDFSFRKSYSETYRVKDQA